MDRRARLELALELLKAARELGTMGASMNGKRATNIRGWAEKLSARGLSLVADDIQAILVHDDQP